MAKKLSEEIATRKRSINFYSLGTYLPDPDIVLRKQGKDVRIYKELLCDPHVFACVQSRKAGVLSLEWDLNRGLDKDKNAEIVEKTLKKLNITNIISDILDTPLFGFTPIEVMWGKVGNFVLPIELKAKPPEWFCFDENNQLKFRTKEHYFGEELPPRKFLCPQSNPSYENPYGERVLSRVFWSVTFKKGGLKFWVVFTEKYGMPHLVGKHPRGATKEETDSLADLLEQMVQDAIAVIPDDSSVEIQEANKSSSAAIYEQLIDKMNAEISKAILGQTLTTEIGGNGSYAAANTHMGIRQDIIDSDKKLVENTINKLIQWIYEINFPNAETPIFELYQEEDVDLSLAQRDKILSDSGVKFSKEYFIKTYGFDDEDIEIREDILPTANPQFSQFEEEPVIEGQKQIDDLFKFLSETELNKQAQKMISPLLSLLENCESYEEAFELLTDKNLHTKQLEQSIQKALFLCELQGRSDGLDD